MPGRRWNSRRRRKEFRNCEHRKASLYIEKSRGRSDESVKFAEAVMQPSVDTRWPLDASAPPTTRLCDKRYGVEQPGFSDNPSSDWLKPSMTLDQKPRVRPLPQTESERRIREVEVFRVFFGDQDGRNDRRWRQFFALQPGLCRELDRIINHLR